MKKKSSNNVDVAEVMVQIQEQLAALDQKMETFITKSLTELAQALAAQKVAVSPRPTPPPPSVTVRPPIQQQPRRPMFAVICFDCGKDCEIPFKPAPGRPVYCQECFAKRKAGNATKASNETKPPVAIKAPEPTVTPKKKAPAAKKSVTKKKTATKKKRK